MQAFPARPKAKRKLAPEGCLMPELPQLPLAMPAQANAQPLPEAEAPAKRVKPEPEDECSPSAPHLPQPAPAVDCLGELTIHIC